jgi:hypothetical protein
MDQRFTLRWARDGLGFRPWNRLGFRLGMNLREGRERLEWARNVSEIGWVGT